MLCLQLYGIVCISFLGWQLPLPGPRTIGGWPTVSTHSGADPNTPPLHPLPGCRGRCRL